MRCAGLLLMAVLFFSGGCVGRPDWGEIAEACHLFYALECPSLTRAAHCGDRDSQTSNRRAVVGA